LRKLATPRPGDVRRTAARNIESILRIEKEDKRQLQPHHRIFHAIGWFVGTVYFFVFQCFAVAVWISANSLAATQSWHFDEFPFPLLSAVLALEAVLLTSCVLIRQNVIDQTSERRNHLDLQINLLAEREATTSLDILQRIAAHLRVPLAKDGAGEDLADETSVDDIARDLRAREEIQERDRGQ
jgi:uncharacterized membrane protein